MVTGAAPLESVGVKVTVAVWVPCVNPERFASEKKIWPGVVCPPPVGLTLSHELLLPVSLA